MGSAADRIIDIGPQPQSFDIERATKENSDYRSVAWSGRYLQVTLMSIPAGGSIGLEAHPQTDQFLRLDAGTRVTTDDRLLPTGTEPAAGKLDFRTPQALRGIALDDAYVDVARDPAGLSWMRLAAPDGRTAAVWMDESMDTWQVCTGDALPNLALRRTGLAAEPMSCIADAFRSGDRVVHLAPGAKHVVTWGATLL